MAEVSKLAAVVSGLVQNVNTSTSDLDVNSLYVGGTSGGGATQLTKTILDNLVTYGQTAIDSITGDATASGPGAAALTLATVNSNVGTFASVTVNGKGLVTAAANLSGDATTSGSALTLATVNSNVGSFGGASSVPTFTVNAKGLITAASATTVVAPAGTLTGTTLNSTVVNSSLTSLGTQAQALNMGSFQINNIASPSASTDAATKGYVDAAINGLTWKGPVQAFADSNVALTGGATLTIDGYSVQNGDYVILSNQTTASQNYVYVASGIGTAYTLTQVTGSEAPTATGDAYLVEKGTQYGNTAYQVNAISPNVTFIQFAGPAALTFTSPLLLTGNVVTIGYDNSTIGDNGSNELYVISGGITETQINNSALSTTGALAGGSGTKLSVKTDGSTISINGSDQLYVPTSGIGTTQLASASVTTAKLGTITDGTTLDQSGAGSTLEIKTGGVGTTQLASASVTAAKLGSVTDGITTDQNGSGSTIEVLQSPAVVRTFTAGQTFSANTSYLVRMGIANDGGTYQNRVYAADDGEGSGNAATIQNFWVIGVANGGAGVTAGNPISVTMLGTYTLASSDTGFSAATNGQSVWLSTAGSMTLTPNSTSGAATVKVGIVQTTGSGASSSIAFGNVQFTGIN